jgi:hypothetical protein
LGVSDGNAYLSADNYNDQQALGDPWNVRTPIQQDDFSMGLIPQAYHAQFQPASQDYFEPSSTHHPSLFETHHQLAPSLPTFHPTRTSVHSDSTTSLPSSSRETYRPAQPLSRSLKISQGRGRAFMASAPPMGAEGGGVSGSDAAGRQSAYSAGAVEEDGNGDGDDDDDEGQGNNNQVVQMIDDVDDDIGPVGIFGSINWWTTHHTRDGGILLIREFQRAVEEVLFLQCYPSFRKGSTKGVNISNLLDRARQKLEKDNPGLRMPRQS